MAQYGRPTLELRYRKAWMLIQFVRNYEILGDAYGTISLHRIA